MEQVQSVIVGVPKSWRRQRFCKASAVYRLEKAGGTYLGNVTCGDEKSTVEFTMLISPANEVLLFAENIDRGGGYANEADIARLHPIAKKLWDEVCGSNPMPQAKECQYHWRSWVVNKL